MIIRRLFAVGTLMMWATLLLVGPVLAGVHPDFSGRWLLDSGASQSMDAILAAQGRTWMERKLYDSVSITQVITQTEKELVIVIESSAAPSRTEHLSLDGTNQTKETARAGTVITRTWWESDKTLTTSTQMKLADGSPADWIIRRSLADEGKTLIQAVELVAQDGRKWTSRRIFRKQ